MVQFPLQTIVKLYWGNLLCSYSASLALSIDDTPSFTSSATCSGSASDQHCFFNGADSNTVSPAARASITPNDNLFTFQGTGVDCNAPSGPFGNTPPTTTGTFNDFVDPPFSYTDQPVSMNFTALFPKNLSSQFSSVFQDEFGNYYMPLILRLVVDGLGSEATFSSVGGTAGATCILIIDGVSTSIPLYVSTGGGTATFSGTFTLNFDTFWTP